MRQRSVVVTFKGQPLTLLGNDVKVGDKAPDVSLQANDLSTVRISDYLGKVILLSAVPSLDTPVCSVETRHFNESAAALGEDVVVLTVSMDLPFAQSRWCAAEGIERVKTLSDHLTASFGEAYGVLIKELRLLARSVWVVDREGMVRYNQLVKEISQEPNYDVILEHVREVQKGAPV